MKSRAFRFALHVLFVGIVAAAAYVVWKKESEGTAAAAAARAFAERAHATVACTPRNQGRASRLRRRRSRRGLLDRQGRRADRIDTRVAGRRCDRRRNRPTPAAISEWPKRPSTTSNRWIDGHATTRATASVSSLPTWCSPTASRRWMRRLRRSSARGSPRLRPSLAAIDSGRRDALMAGAGAAAIGLLLMFVLVPLPRSPVPVPAPVAVRDPASGRQRRVPRGRRPKAALPAVGATRRRQPGRRPTVAHETGRAGARSSGMAALCTDLVARDRHAGAAAGARARRQAPRRFRTGDLGRRPGRTRADCR